MAHIDSHRSEPPSEISEEGLLSYLSGIFTPEFFEKRVRMRLEDSFDKRPSKIFRQVRTLGEVTFKSEPASKTPDQVVMTDTPSSPGHEPFSGISKEVRTVVIVDSEPEPTLETRKKWMRLMENYENFPTPSLFPYCNNHSRVILVDDKNGCGRLPRRERGTTTLAFIFKDGIMVAADHSWKPSSPNMIEVNSHIIATISGASGNLIERLRRKCCDYEGVKGRRISVALAAKLMAESIHPCMSTGGLLIGGWDEKGPILYHVNRNGKLEDVKEKRYYRSGRPLKWLSYATGSGAERAIVYLDHAIKQNMSVDEAKEVAKAAICTASYKATEIGDFFSVYHIRNTGWEKLISGDDAKEWQKRNMKKEALSGAIEVSIYPPAL